MKHLCWSCRKGCSKQARDGYLTECKNYVKRNPFQASFEIDKEDKLQVATVSYGDFDIELRVTFNLQSEDMGIGHHEFWGVSGFHSDIQVFAEELESVELMTLNNSKEIEAYFNRYHEATKEERDAMFKAGVRCPKHTFDYTEININDEKYDLLLEAINNAI